MTIEEIGALPCDNGKSLQETVDDYISNQLYYDIKDALQRAGVIKEEDYYSYSVKEIVQELVWIALRDYIRRN